MVIAISAESSRCAVTVLIYFQPGRDLLRTWSIASLSSVNNSYKDSSGIIRQFLATHIEMYPCIKFMNRRMSNCDYQSMLSTFVNRIRIIMQGMVHADMLYVYMGILWEKPYDVIATLQTIIRNTVKINFQRR